MTDEMWLRWIKPMGLQVVGRHFDEAMVLRLGHAIEASRECAVREAGMRAMKSRAPQRCGSALLKNG
jgi:hypothetical protein